MATAIWNRSLSPRDPNPTTTDRHASDDGGDDVYRAMRQRA
jgi:hypothetical protein